MEIYSLLITPLIDIFITYLVCPLLFAAKNITSFICQIKTHLISFIHKAVSSGGIEDVIDTITADNWLDLLGATGLLTGFILFLISSRGFTLMVVSPILVQAGGIVGRALIDLRDPTGASLKWLYLGVSVKYTLVRYREREYIAMVYKDNLTPIATYIFIMLLIEDIINDMTFMSIYRLWLHCITTPLGETCIIGVTPPNRLWWLFIRLVFNLRIINEYGVGRTEIDVTSVVVDSHGSYIPLRANFEEVREPIQVNALYDSIEELNRDRG